MPAPQCRYYILTIPFADWNPCLPDGVAYCRGQRERGSGGFEHWQLIAYFSSKVTLTRCKRCFCSTAHVEPTRSGAALEYVWKEDTRVPDSQFEFGQLPCNRNQTKDWDAIWDYAKNNQLESIPSDVRIRCYSSLRKIATDFATPIAMERTCYVFWGRTGTGKSRKAWEDAGLEAYPKDPRTKFWCGYTCQTNVVIDEFRGGIDIAHLLRWLDRYPVIVEIKGGAVVLRAVRIWITSNLPPEQWYPQLDDESYRALRRRLTVTHFDQL